ncbi:hypothetical protein [Tomitella gaofuii]|uniref:hypothetical protein n=1 Tax=Tomitella gaofuii TaxID=2760083 RepID=UPI0015FC7A08|nr:hypothetical protein [Tomitella gaofuii]
MTLTRPEAAAPGHAAAGGPRRAGRALRANAAALIISTGVTSAAGFAFWAIAARLLPTHAVGVGTALVSAMTLLANLATLGLRNGLVRFLPVAGASSRRLIAGAYAASATAAVLAAAVFLAGQRWWAPQLAFLRDGAATACAFIAATAVWVLFVLQDQILIGLRSSVWVPVANALYSVAKLAAVPLFAASATWAVFAATTLPAAAAVAGVSVLVLALTARRRAAGSVAAGGGAEDGEAARGGVEPARFPLRLLVRFAAYDQAAWLVWMAVPEVLTLIALNVRGADASAYYYMANAIGYSLYLVTSNIGSALIAESAHDPLQSVAHARRALGYCVALVVPAALFGTAVAPLVLRVLGNDYEAGATGALRLILLSAIPQIVVGISVSTARVRGDMRTVVAVYVLIAAMIWTGSWFALSAWGVTGIGAAVLVAQCTAAALLLATGKTGLFGDAGGRAALAGAPRAWRQRRLGRDAAGGLGAALAACGFDVGAAVRRLDAESDTLVLAVDDAGVPAVLKLSTSAAADRGLGRHAETVARLRASIDADAAAVLPTVRTIVRVEGRTAVCETRLPGRPFDAGAAASAAEAAAAFAALGRVQRGTARAVRVDGECLRRWVDTPLDVLRGADGAPGALALVRERLRAPLDGATVVTAQAHGDFWPGNVLADGAAVTGIVDWENGDPDALPDLDPVHWYLATRPAELGAAACAALRDPDGLRRFLADADAPRPNPALPLDVLVLLAWLQHVSNTRLRATRNAPGAVWHRRNVRPVLQLVAGGSGGAVRFGAAPAGTGRAETGGARC